MSKLDDLLAKKKTVVPVLDLSRNVVQSSEELKRLMEKVPEFKMRPIKVKAEDIKTKDKDFSFKLSKKEVKKLLKSNGERDPMYVYADPVPIEMKEVVLYDLCVVPIDWKMLTTLRPKSKIEEEYFSRMVEMGKLQLKTEQRDRREFMLNNGVKKLKNKSGIVETRLQTCTDCGEELCSGKTCTEFSYDLFVRVEPKFSKPKPTANVINKGKLNGRKRIINGPRNKAKKNPK
ncbi:hypothetical protein FF38_10973 [Lucilia cuprina]|uniref:Uncharacterized protein n=1 Tax=Lucilia cuprina TaxID=7375 RepID=A0A0L0BXH7_LUCCU|nr:uncharacterized protein LOC111679036 isoform X1 [Lucilia cuprina]KAI8122272.1 hypothetical protein CVS40_6849 [Lucilia cuprina]KAI8122273.1 hypothetical protein CVS40_6849 [Lucilia cuprina]KNC24710.1 hypothetical protein FF38_10973 [Lucilia cuprina]